MELLSFMRVIGQRKGILIKWTLGLFVLAVIFTFVQPLKYGVSSQMLITQNFGRVNDPYALSRSNEYLSSTMARVVMSNYFFEKVMMSGYNIDRSYFSTDLNTQMSLWDKTVVAKAIGDTGVIEIEVYHPDKAQAVQLALAVNSILRSDDVLSLGTNNNLVIKVLNQPMVSRWPIKPNIIYNVLAGLILGFAFGLFHIYAIAIGLIVPKKKKNQEILENLTIEKLELEKASVIVEAPVATPFVENNYKTIVEETQTNSAQQNIQSKQEVFAPQGDIGNVIGN